MSRLAALDIANLPPAEDERFEYKRSTTPFKSLKDKLACAASGFWNSGGGIFIAGVDGVGKPDGGIDCTVGRQPVRDWLDQVVQEVAPPGKHFVRVFAHDPSSGLNIAADKCVIGVEFDESIQSLHMAPDHRYYIRAGAHTVPASHYIVEALWARRRVQRPQLAHAMRLKPDATDIIQLAVVALTDEPAVAVSIVLDPLPEMWKDTSDLFPLELPLLDRTTPFYLDVTTYFDAEKRLGTGVQLRIAYNDVAGNTYNYTATLDVLKSIAPWKIGTPANEKMAKSLESIDKTLGKVPTALDRLQEENSQLRGRLEALQSVAFSQRVREPAAIAAQLSSNAIALMLAAKDDGTIIFSPYVGGSRLSSGKTQFISSPGDAREEARWKSAVSELRDIELIDGVFARGNSSVFRLTNLGYEVADTIQPPADDLTGTAEA
jgi:hypothetical protein